MLVAPVTEAGVLAWEVYLPKDFVWYDLWTGKKSSGGQTLRADASENKIPVFVKGGSIIPLGKQMQYTGQKSADTLEIRIYKGADGRFDMYEDEGDNYNYEKGKYTVIPFKWSESTKSLSIGSLQGTFAGSLKSRVFNVVVVKEGVGIDETNHTVGKLITYKGKNVSIRLE
jgi:alpha-D-xyloside xylohydrolase